jgi:hypothetical protein
MTDHVCFECRRAIVDHEPHIHVPLDEWSASVGLPALGLDDLLTFVFCLSCTHKAKRGGWTPEAHEIAEDG